MDEAPSNESEGFLLRLGDSSANGGLLSDEDALLGCLGSSTERSKCSSNEMLPSLG